MISSHNPSAARVLPPRPDAALGYLHRNTGLEGADPKIVILEVVENCHFEIALIGGKCPYNCALVNRAHLNVLSALEQLLTDELRKIHASRHAG